MKDQYVGDINDFAKYQLLRLFGHRFREVIVAWMLTPEDERSDGGRVRYLTDVSWRAEDPELFDVLAELTENGTRSIATIEKSGALVGCRFASERIDGRAGRSSYFDRIVSLAGPDALVFFDPDNGLEVPSVPKHRKGAERYLYWDELARVCQTGASVLIYQHFPRVDRRKYVNAMLKRLTSELKGDFSVFAVHSSQVAFLFAIRKSHAVAVMADVEGHCATSRLLSLVAPTQAR